MVGFYACIVMVPCFWLLALFFAVGRERAANWLSGFHGLSKEEKAKYDRARMAKDERNACFLWGLIMLFGAMGAMWISGWGPGRRCGLRAGRHWRPMESGWCCSFGTCIWILTGLSKSISCRRVRRNLAGKRK